MSADTLTPQRWHELAALHHAGLLDTVAFWERHAVDRDCGGFLYYLDRTGRPYGTDKPVWLLGRTVWLFATLYTAVEPRPAWLALARHAWDFLDRHAFAEDGKMYFLLDRQGRPLRMRRYHYSEVFAVLAAAALARATGDAALLQRAVEIYDRFDRALRTPGVTPPKVNPAVRPTKGLAPRMCHLLLADTLAQQTGAPRYEAAIDDTAAELFRDFVKPDDGCVLETVGPDGQRGDDPDGRTMNPGHAIEAAWFLLMIARRRGDADLARRALPIIDWSFARGWDPEHGGLLYFVDVAGHPPTQLEHDMKLWWPHCEALVATLLAHAMTGDARYARLYEQVHAWTHAHFPDPEYGEWYGYLHRDGSLSTPLKGGPWKGPFHVPRAQLLCWQIARAQSAAARP
jgi:N-acylglucosamine 2-epimerase